MTISIDPSTLVITVEQADCTLISGTFYRLPTETVFRAAMNDLLDDEVGMHLPFAISHNTEVAVAGVTYARFIELINGYSLQFLPNSAWTVELTESNNNLHDVASGVLVQNQVQVITTNAAGLIVVSTGSGLSPAQDILLSDINNRTTYHSKIINNYRELLKIGAVWYLIVYDDGQSSGGIEILRKAMKDNTGNDITDLLAGVMSDELANTI